MKTTFFTILVFIALISCKKDVSQLPDATDIGANTFGAQVNGTFWKPQGFGIVPTSPLLEARYILNRDVIINARNFSSEPTETEFEIYLKHVVAPGTYELKSNTAKYPSQTANYGYYIKRKLTPVNEWITTTQYTGKVVITKADTLNHIVSGTFEFNAINMYSAPEALTVTNGRFDVKVQ